MTILTRVCSNNLCNQSYSGVLVELFLISHSNSSSTVLYSFNFTSYFINYCTVSILPVHNTNAVPLLNAHHPPFNPLLIKSDMCGVPQATRGAVES